MKSGAEKSHSLIVPAKPANKAAQSAAELVEGSGGTERNAGRQRTVRTQSREAVSQAQARIREAVNRNKGGEADSTPAPYQPRLSALGFLHSEEGRRTGGRRSDLGTIRGRP